MPADTLFRDDDDDDQACFQGCCSNPLLRVQESPIQKDDSKPRNTSAACRHSFADTTSSFFFPNTQFTNHESLPSLRESFAQFIKAYPQYSETRTIDNIRAQEYYNLTLSKHVCLDYIGIGLFSYAQVQSQLSAIVPFASSSSPSPQFSDFPFFDVSFKSVNLKSELLQSSHGSEFESGIKKRILDFLNISQQEYSMIFTANKSSAFKLVADSYPFQSNRKLLTVYDHDSEALQTMVNTAEKRRAQVSSAEFKWPRLRVHAENMRKMIVSKKKRDRGLFVFPLQSRVTGSNYSYQWMSLAQENGWHVLLDACALGPKDMDSFGLSLFHPDFLVCSFYKVFGDNPTGFGCLIAKKSAVSILEDSKTAGIVTLEPQTQLFRSPDSSGTDTELEQMPNVWMKADNLNGKSIETETSRSKGNEFSPNVTTSENSGNEESAETIPALSKNPKLRDDQHAAFECKCLDQVDSLGLMLVNNRRRYLVNWLITALMKLQHPNRLDSFPLVRIYGPKIKFDRGPALAFNVYDWKGEKVDPTFIQKLADRNHISLSQGFLQNIWFPDKYEEERDRVLEKRKDEEKEAERKKSNKKAKQGIAVVTVALSFLANFEDTYKFWAFIARFLDADFVEKERWRYTALNQKKVEVL
nr:molybdenum cofactor sulfurase-like [Ipomoea batatas]